MENPITGMYKYVGKGELGLLVMGVGTYAICQGSQISALDMGDSGHTLVSSASVLVIFKVIDRGILKDVLATTLHK